LGCDIAVTAAYDFRGEFISIFRLYCFVLHRFHPFDCPHGAESARGAGASPETGPKNSENFEIGRIIPKS
jgi:hypothetical protein